MGTYLHVNFQHISLLHMMLHPFLPRFFVELRFNAVFIGGRRRGYSECSRNRRHADDTVTRAVLAASRAVYRGYVKTGIYRVYRNCSLLFVRDCYLLIRLCD